MAEQRRAGAWGGAVPGRQDPRIKYGAGSAGDSRGRSARGGSGSAYATRSGAALAQVASPGKGQELAAAKAALGQIPLEGRIVVADALLTQREVCQQIVSGGGDYLLPVKENQPALRRDLVEAFSPTGN